MEYYVGLDVSLKQTSICVVDQAGLVVREGVVDSDPEAISVFVRSKRRARYASASCSRCRSTRTIATMLSGSPASCRPVGSKRCTLRISTAIRSALLASRALLVKIKRDLENHVRGLLKNLGLVIGRATFNVFAVRAEELIEDRPDLVAAVRPLLEARNAVGAAGQ
jgi:transposase